MRTARPFTPVLLRSVLLLPLAPWMAGSFQEPGGEEGATVERPVVVDIAPRDWLVVEPRRGAERGLAPDSVFLRYVLWPGREVPVEGAELRDGRVWRRVETDRDGRIAVPFDYAYALIEVEDSSVLLAHASGAETLFVGGQAFQGDPERRGGHGVPVALEAGENPVYLRGGDGGRVCLAFAIPRAT